MERYLLEEFDYPVEPAVSLLQVLHRRAFGRLYDWAGKWRTQVPNVGAYLPHPQLLYEFADELRHRQAQLPPILSGAELAAMLSHGHHQPVAIHPFTNGNGRTARLFTNQLAYNYGYQDVALYHRENGEGRNQYVPAIDQVDEDRCSAASYTCLRSSRCPLVRGLDSGQRHGLILLRHGGVH
ncbi:Fic family protein [Hymenobacter terricola]|uniref:Fic family protein n=1 Tax=Hymenobacter terricola TaxID=2819236 RepID=UPI001B302698|nr:Fic family protein [Hymenobacter terricola]